MFIIYVVVLNSQTAGSGECYGWRNWAHVQYNVGERQQLRIPL